MVTFVYAVSMLIKIHPDENPENDSESVSVIVLPAASVIEEFREVHVSIAQACAKQLLQSSGCVMNSEQQVKHLEGNSVLQFGEQHRLKHGPVTVGS
jgi:hypothetical protein